MAYGFIDSASIMGAVGALTTHNTPQDWDIWTGQSITEVTIALVLHDGLKIAPGPSKPAQLRAGVEVSKLYQGYDQACKLLADVLKETPVQEVPSLGIRKSAENAFRDWVQKNVEHARCAIKETRQESGCPHWEEWARENAWVDHSRQLNGLFDAEMIDELALVLEVESTDLRSLWKKTTDLRQVRSWSQGKNLDSDFDLARDAFLAAAILRGLYHDYIAHQMKWDHMHHPIRQHILVPSTQGTEYEVTEVANYLVNIITNSAMEERKPEDRVACWVENLRTVRLKYHQGEIGQIIEPQYEGEKAEKIAFDIAKKSDLRLYPRSLEKQLEWSTIGGTTVLTAALGSLILFPWGTVVGGLVSLGLGAAGMRKPLGKGAARKLKLTRGHLRELAISEPGRIARIWRRLR